MEINKSLRISLTESCNYKCFFCHEEGLNMNKRRSPKSKEEVYELIDTGLKNGYRDLTFTGGEPLIKKKDILWYFKKLDENKVYPDITIVTNGLLIDDELLDCIFNYKGRFKFNISLHSLNPEDYERIICVTKNLNVQKVESTNFKKVTENIRKIKGKKLKVKLNFVLLKGINTGKDKIKEILDFALENNIDYIKFLELLVIEGKENLYKYFTEIEQIEEIWKDKLKLLSKDIPRRRLYLYKDRVKVELQKCTCSFGCASCLKNRDVNITAELKYFPCFILSNEDYKIDKKNFVETVKRGNNKIREFAKKYKSDSPILAKKAEYIKHKSDFYYISEIEDTEQIKKILEKNNNHLYKTYQTTERYYFSQKNKLNRIRKLFMHSHNESEYTEVIQDYKLNNENGGILITFFYNIPLKIEKDKLSEYEMKLKDKDIYLENILEWDIKFFNLSNNNQISVGIEKNSKRLFILSPEKEIRNNKIMECMKLKKINKLPIYYLKEMEGR